MVAERLGLALVVGVILIRWERFEYDWRSGHRGRALFDQVFYPGGVGLVVWLLISAAEAAAGR